MGEICMAGNVYGRGRLTLNGVGGGNYSVDADAGVWAKIAILGADIWESPFMLYLHGYVYIGSDEKDVE